MPQSFAFRGEVDPNRQPFALRCDPVGLPTVHQAPPKALVQPDRWCSDIDDIEHQSTVMRQTSTTTLPRATTCQARVPGRAQPVTQTDARRWLGGPY